MQRMDERRPDQLRPVCVTRNFTTMAEASVLIEMGQTRVICTATVEDKVPPHCKGTGKGWVTAEYSMLPRATPTRSAREAARGKQTGRTQEIQRLIGRSLRGVTDLTRLGERTITIDCDVIQADGGTRVASITGGYIALFEAIQALMQKGLLTQNPLNEFVAAVSVGIVDGQPLLDLCYVEDSTCGTDLNVVMTESGNLIEIQGTAEGAAFSRSELSQMLELAQKGILELVTHQKKAFAIQT